jgi:hypothetical protein
MKKVTPLILTFTLTLMAGSLAHAMDDDVRPEYAALRQDVLAMDNSLRRMEEDVKGLRNDSRCRETLKALDSRMTEMRMRMHQVDNYAQQSGDMPLSHSLAQLNRAMTETLKGIGQCLRDKERAIPMIEDGVRHMRIALDEVRALI